MRILRINGRLLQRLIRIFWIIIFFSVIAGEMKLFAINSLHQAVVDGDHETVKKILNGELKNLKISVNQDIQERVRIFSEFISYRSKAEVEEFLDREFGKYDIRSLYKWTLLNWAVFNNDLPMVKLLLEFEFDPNSTDGINATPLHWACLWASSDIIKKLLNHGAKIFIRDDEGFTPLYRALQRKPEIGDVEIIRLLIQRGAKPTRTDKMGRNAFHIAAMMSNLDVLNYLRTVEPSLLNSLDHFKNNVLHLAVSSKVKNNNLLVIKNLVNMGVNIEYENKNSLTPFHMAVYKRNLPGVQFFFEYSDNPNIQNRNGDTPLHIAAKWGFVDVIRVIYNVLLSKNKAGHISVDRKKQFNPNQRNRDGIPPFNLALYNNHVLAAQELMKFININPLEYDAYGETGLHLAARSRNLELMDNLLERARQINSKEMFWLENGQGQRPIEVAAWNGDAEMVIFLLKRGGLVSNQHSDITRLLASARSLEVERILLRYRDDPKTFVFD